MYFIGDDDCALSISDEMTCEERILMFDYRIDDYFLEWSMAWNLIKTPVYTVSLGDRVFKIPSSQYVICGEAGGVTDLIMFDEIIGREIDVLVITNDCRKVEWHIPRIIAVDVEGQLFYPMVQKFVAMSDSENTGFILTSGNDKLSGKTIEYDEFIV